MIQNSMKFNNENRNAANKEHMEIKFLFWQRVRKIDLKGVTNNKKEH